jgi:hypothetical protein
MKKYVIIPIFLLLLAFVLAGCSPAPKEFKSEAGGFSVMSPVTLMESHQEIETEAGKLDLHLFSGQLDDVGYFVSYTDYEPEIVRKADPEKMLDGSRDGAVSNVNGKLVSETRITLAGHPGRELVIDAKPKETPPGTIKERIFMVQNRLYQVVVVAPRRKDIASEADAFLQSFKLLGK